MRLQEPRRELPSWLWFLLAIAAGALIGIFVLRPLLSANNGTATSNAEPTVRCADPAGGQLALLEYVRPGLETGSVSFTRDYRLERPAQAPIAFSGGGDASSAPLSCDNVRFGPGARVSFGRGPEAFSVQFVGPTVNRFSALKDTNLVRFALDPRWKGRLNLADYSAGAPAIDENGRGRLELTRASVAPGLPSRIVLSTVNSGATYNIDESATLAGLR